MHAYHTMKFAALVPLRLSPIVLGLTRTELSKVFSCLGYHILEQLHLNPPQLLPCFAYVSHWSLASRATLSRSTTGTKPRKLRVEHGAG
jgi:hypothetical protein